MKDEFLAIMSHELKHPLNLIQVNAQLLLALPEVRELKTVTKIGQAIQSTVRSQARIIDDLLDISRTRTGKLMLQPADLDLTEALQSSLQWAENHAQERGIRLELQIAPGPLPVRGDPARIEQIAMNLLSNAFKFGVAGGRVGVTLRSLGDEAVFEVSDSGRGIRPEFLPHVFGMFKQDAPRTTARELAGLGIGLALVRDLVQLHGGEVSARSPGLGHGATFTVRLPIHVPSGFTPLDAGADEDALAGLRVLFVDDSTDTLESFAELMSLDGAVVQTAPSATQALDCAAAETFDLLLSDIGMPGMDGYDLIAELRRRETTRALPAIALTGYGRALDDRRALDAGFNAHLSKPIDIRRLKALVRSLGVGRAA
jgi:two-component system CheB/CheR fusion protein